MYALHLATHTHSLLIADWPGAFSFELEERLLLPDVAALATFSQSHMHSEHIVSVKVALAAPGCFICTVSLQ